MSNYKLTHCEDDPMWHDDGEPFDYTEAEAEQMGSDAVALDKALAERDGLWQRAIETVFNVVFSGYARSTRRQWSEDIAREVARLSAATEGAE